MHISRIDKVFYILAFVALIVSFYTIVIHIGFMFIPIFFLIIGTVISFLPSGWGLKTFFILIPIINSIPAFFFNGYPFNLMATLLFFLSGIIIGSFFKKEAPLFEEISWAGSYLFFLVIIWVSAVFVLLRWSNITMPYGAIFTDTPVAPGLPLSPRNSFAIIFPVITIFLFSLTPFVAALIKKYSVKKEEIFKLIIYGYSGSVFISIYQKFIDNGFMSLEWWGKKMNQYNGGFSDFNGYGFFGGVIFLYSALTLMSSDANDQKKDKKRRIFFFITAMIISFSGILLSGSRTAFIFVIFAFIFLMFSKVRRIYKIILPVILIVVLLISGGELVKRLEHTFDSSRLREGNGDLLDTIDDFSNGRVSMIVNSIPMVKKYPISGVGAGNFLFYLKYMKYGEEFIEDLPLNQYLLFLDELGVIGFFSFLFFIFLLLKGKRKDRYYKIFVVILLVMMVGNSLWLPEIFILFWITAISVSGTKRSESSHKWKWRFLPQALLVLFILSNVVTFNSLHPSVLMSSRGLSYDYGFWEESENTGFVWTGAKAGILLHMDKNGMSIPLKFFCGAPLGRLPGQFQLLKIFKNGNPVETKKFISNGEFILHVRGEPEEGFFLGIEVDPIFNIKKMGIGNETRDLGIQFFPETGGDVSTFADPDS